MNHQSREQFVVAAPLAATAIAGVTALYGAATFFFSRK